MAGRNLQYWIIPTDHNIESEEFPNIEFIFDEEIELKASEFIFESDQHEIVTVNATLFEDAVTLDCSDIKSPGIWTLTIPEGVFKSIYTGSINSEKTYQWQFVSTTSGVTNTGHLGQKLSVYQENVEILGYDEIIIFDLCGNLIAQYQGNVNIALKSGFYFIKCIEGNNITTYKVIK